MLENYKGKRDRKERMLLFSMIFVIVLMVSEAMADHRRSDSLQIYHNDTLSGTVTMAGSTSMEPIANALAEGFMNRYPHMTVRLDFTGSSGGIGGVLCVWVYICNAS